MIRKPVVAGMFYESDKELLKKQIEGCFYSRFGPGDLPKDKPDKQILGIISPHAGYIYSGMCAAHGYKELAECRKPDVFILLGLSHQGYGSCVSLEDWETPLGIAKNDKEFGKELMTNTGLKQDENAHSQEHSIEVQIPFLQYIFKENLKILPIIISKDRNYEQLAKQIVRTIKDSKKEVCIIASSDFTHYGINYGYVPFRDNVKRNIYDLDNNAIKQIKSMDAYKFLNYADETGATICGKYPVALLIELCRLMNKGKVKLLKYYTSADIINDYSSAVGYASIIIE